MVPSRNVPRLKGPLHLQSRVSYLYKAAAYFSGLPPGIESEAEAGKEEFGRELSQSTGHGQTSWTSKYAAIKYRHLEIPVDMNTAESGAKPSATYDEATARAMLLQIEGIAKKGQVGLSPLKKHSICKRCKLLLIDGRNASQRLENKSRGGKKPWADVFVVTCNSCGTRKHYPVGAKRQPQKKDRSIQSQGHNSDGTDLIV